jgi:hypothetical protein
VPFYLLQTHHQGRVTGYLRGRQAEIKIKGLEWCNFCLDARGYQNSHGGEFLRTLKRLASVPTGGSETDIVFLA